MGLSFDVFKAQVIPYLTPDHQEIYGTPEAWDRMPRYRRSRFRQALTWPKPDAG